MEDGHLARTVDLQGGNLSECGQKYDLAGHYSRRQMAGGALATGATGKELVPREVSDLAGLVLHSREGSVLVSEGQGDRGVPCLVSAQVRSKQQYTLGYQVDKNFGGFLQETRGGF